MLLISVNSQKGSGSPQEEEQVLQKIDEMLLAAEASNDAMGADTYVQQLYSGKKTPDFTSLKEELLLGYFAQQYNKQHLRDKYPPYWLVIYDNEHGMQRPNLSQLARLIRDILQARATLGRLPTGLKQVWRLITTVWDKRFPSNKHDRCPAQRHGGGLGQFLQSYILSQR